MSKELIRPESFYSDQSEKIRLNWFIYELALAFEKGLQNMFQSQRYRKYKISKKDLANFCIFAAKEMKKVVTRLQSGELSIPQISYKMVESFLPKASKTLIDKTLEVLAVAWDQLTSYCESTCPTKCLNDKAGFCTMFDEGPY